MLNQRLFNSQTRPHRSMRPHRRGLSRWQAALLCLFTALTAGALPAASDNMVDIAGAPVFLLSGTPPNVILTIDNSKSMNKAFLPDDIWGTGDRQPPPRIDRQDTAALTNRQYYDPAVTYLPPLNVKGKSVGHARFEKARVDALAAFAECKGCVEGNFENCDETCPSTGSGCTLHLGEHYAPVWNLTPSYGEACKDLAADATLADVRNLYSADVDHPDFPDFQDLWNKKDVKEKVALGAEWAWRCFKEKNDCPAFYYRYKLPPPNTECAALDLQRISAKEVPSECLERVIVGEGSDLSVVLDKNKTNIYPDVLRDRQAKLKDPDEALTEGDLARRNFANWFSYYRTRLQATQTAVSRVMAGFPERMRLGYQGAIQGQYKEGEIAYDNLAATFARYEADPRPDAPSQKTSKLDFYQWLYPTRTLDSTFTLSAALRAHEFCSSEQAYLDYPQAEPDSLTNREYGCRKNFHVIFTDGFWEDLMPKKTPPPRGFDPPAWLENNDGEKKDLPPPSQQSYAQTQGITQYDPAADYARIFHDQNRGMLADVAFYSWITDLRPDLGIVEHAVPTLIRAVSGTPEEIFWNPLNDPADWQHLNTFTVGFGVAGNVHYPDGDYETNPDGSPCTNPDGTPCTIVKNGFPGDYDAISLDATGAWTSKKIPVPVKVDDTWHAGINGRGGYLNAGDPSELATRFQEVLNLIGTMAKDSSAAAAAVNTGSTASQDVVYQARLNSAGWSGDIRSFQVSAGLGNPPCAALEVVPGQLCQDPASGDYYRSAADAIREETHNTRLIITAAPSKTTKDQEGVPFSWDNLSDSGKLDFLKGAGFTGKDPTTATDEQELEAKARLDYVAGDKTYEVDGELYRFRTRPLLPVPNKVAACKDPTSNPTACTNLLGDFINSAPVMVGPPAFYYNATDYIAYKEKHRDRVTLVYAGANDGMLHAFYADTLEEAFAFIPPVLMEHENVRDPLKRRGLHQLSLTEYTHQNYVDGPIAIGDVRFSDTGWHTMLVGTLGLGAQALYALDVTDAPPTAVNLELDAKKLFQWEFTDRGDGDPDLGYIFGRPAIVRVRAELGGATGEPIWVVITGNGYNSSEDDGSRAKGCDAPGQDQAGKAPCGQAVLYVIAMDDGRVIKKIETGVGRRNDPLNPSDDPSKQRSNALGQATVVTSSIESGDIVADFAYAADLFGNLYRFDLTGDSEEPEVRTLFSAVDAKGIAQPITAPIAVARHPLGLGTLVLFGTGKYLDLADIEANPEPQVQSFYAIWDIGSNTQTAVGRDKLLEQEFLETNLRMTTDEGEEVTRGRTSTAKSIDWSKHLGWYIDFDIEKDTVAGLNKGERVVTEPDVQGGRVIFVSLVPETNPCAGGGYSWITALDVRNGSRLGITPFDFDLDGTIGEADLLTTSDGGKVVGSSVRLTPGGRNTGIYSSPSSFGDGAGRVTTVVSTSEGDLALINAADIQAWRVWQQLR